MCFERPYDLESLGEDADVAVVAADEDVVGPGTDTVEIIALATSALKQICLLETRLTSKAEELSPSLSGNVTSETSKKLKTFHYRTTSA